MNHDRNDQTLELLDNMWNSQINALQSTLPLGQLYKADETGPVTVLASFLISGAQAPDLKHKRKDMLTPFAYPNATGIHKKKERRNLIFNLLIFTNCLQHEPRH